MLIDTREPPREPEPERSGAGTALARALGWLYPWPMVVLWLWLGGVVVDDLPGMAFALGALLVSFWRLSRAYPAWGGLSDHRQ